MTRTRDRVKRARVCGVESIAFRVKPRDIGHARTADPGPLPRPRGREPGAYTLKFKLRGEREFFTPALPGRSALG